MAGNAYAAPITASTSGSFKRGVRSARRQQRLLRASQLYMTGLYTVEDIAEQLSTEGFGDISANHVQADLCAINLAAKATHALNLKEALNRELTKLDMMENLALEHYVETTQDPEVKRRYMDQMLRIQDRRVKLLEMLNPPQNKVKRVSSIEWTGKDGEKVKQTVAEMSDDDLLLLAKGATEFDDSIENQPETGGFDGRTIEGDVSSPNVGDGESS